MDIETPSQLWAELRVTVDDQSSESGLKLLPSFFFLCCSAKKPIQTCVPAQVYVDIETPSQLWDELRVTVEEYLGSHPEYYSGNCAVFCFGASDPLKLQLGVFFEYSFNGAPHAPG